MKLENLNYKIPFNKSDGCVLINAKDWQDNTTQLIQAYNFKGEHCISNLNKVLKTNYNEEIYGTPLKEGDLIFISSQASKISYLRPFKLHKGVEEYANVHLLQVIGKFEDNVISYDNFVPLYNKIFMKKVTVRSAGLLDLGDMNSTIIGEVLKTGTHGYDSSWNKTKLNTKVGQYVLVRDNISTEITLDGTDYIATEDNMIIGYFTEQDFSLDSLNVFDKNIILEKYEEEKVEGSSLFIKPSSIDENTSDISELYTDNRFKVVKVGENVTGVQVGDKVIVDKDYTNYVTVEGKRYYLLNGTMYIQAVFN